MSINLNFKTMDWIQEKENLQHLIEEGVPYETIGKKYNCSGANIRKVSKKLGIELPKRRNINPKEHFNKNVSLKEKSRCIVCGKETTKTTSKYCSSKC